MAILSGLLVAEPSGVWVNIIRAFEGATKNYILGIILLTVVIKVIFSIPETIQRFSQHKMNESQAKLKPEMDKIAKKYANQPQVIKQKQNELQMQKGGKSQMGGCLVMLVVMILNLVIFTGLFTGLNTMGAYKVATQYESLKYTYVNCLKVTDEYLTNSGDQSIFTDLDNVKYVIENDIVKLLYNNEEKASVAYKTDFSDPVVEMEESTEEVVPTNNKNIVNLINKFFLKTNVNPETQETIPGGEWADIILVPAAEEGQENLYLSSAVQDAVIVNVCQTYDTTKESFVWIDNIWASDTPFADSMGSFDGVEDKLGIKNDEVKEQEKTIKNAFIEDLRGEKNKKNGYLILPILCIALSLLSMQIPEFYNKYKAKKKGLPYVKPQTGKAMKLIMPVLLGVFALFYNSVFAAYMLTGQIVSIVLMIPEMMIVDAIAGKKKEKEKNENIVDYSRKF